MASENMRHYSTNIEFSWLHPSQSTLEHYLRSSVVSVRNVATRTFVYAVVQSLPDFSSAYRTLLRRVPRIVFNNFTTSIFGFVAKYADELPPGSIGNRPGKLVVLEHTNDIQALHNDQAVAIN